MLQIDHRESHDIDLFLDNAQLLPLLNPETQGMKLERRPDSYMSSTTALKLAYNDLGEIDFICCASLLEAPTRLARCARDARGDHRKEGLLSWPQLSTARHLRSRCGCRALRRRVCGGGVAPLWSCPMRDSSRNCPEGRPRFRRGHQYAVDGPRVDAPPHRTGSRCQPSRSGIGAVRKWHSSPIAPSDCRRGHVNERHGAEPNLRFWASKIYPETSAWLS